MAGTFAQLAAFGTDIVGLERVLRLVQATLLIATSYPALLAPVAGPGAAAAGAALAQAQAQLNLTRRALRLFWFLGSLRAGAAERAWLGAVAHSALGLFGLLESATLLDLAAPPPLALLGAARAARLDAEAQVLWLVALLAAALGSAARLVRLLAAPRRPEAPDAARAAPAAPKADVVEPARPWPAGATPLAMKLLAELLDMPIPASTLGWIDVDAGLVGIAMFCSTVLTSIAVWERCRQQLDRAGA